MMHRGGKFLLAGVILLALPGVASASLIGDFIDIEWLDDAGSLGSAEDVRVVDPGLEVSCEQGITPGTLCGPTIDWVYTLDVADSSISYAGEKVPSPFVQLRLSDLDWVDQAGNTIPGSITRVTLGANNLLNFGINWFSNAVWIDGLTTNPGDESMRFELLLEVSHDPTPPGAPEPGTVLLLGLGLAGLGIARRRA